MKPALYFASGAVLATAITIGTYAMSGPDSLQSCLLVEMKGQPAAMMPAAYQLCTAKFPPKHQMTLEEMNAKADELFKAGKNPFDAFLDEGQPPTLLAKVRHFLGLS